MKKKKKSRRQQYRKKKTLLKSLGFSRSKKSRRKSYRRKKFIKNKNNRLFLVLVVAVFLLGVDLVLISYDHKVEAQEKKKEKIETERMKKLEAKIKKEQEEEENKPIEMGDIVFLGDSITEYYDLEKYFDVPIVNSGSAGWDTDQILEDLDNKVYKYKCKKVFILIGTNDFDHGKDENHILDNIKIIIKDIKEKNKRVKIYIQSVYPVNNTNNRKINHKLVGTRVNENIKELNQQIKEYCEKNSITYINMYDKLVDEEGNLNIDYTVEGLHINDTGYEIITQNLNEYINEK